MRKISLGELKKIVAAHALWLKSNGQEGERANLGGADLDGFDLSHADLADADLNGANLARADLSGAVLFHANLSGAILFHANLTAAKLFRASLNGANLVGSNLAGAHLVLANLSDATLDYASLGKIDTKQAGGTSPDDRTKTRRANFKNARLRGASLREVDLTEVGGLDADILAGTDLTRAKLPDEIAAFSGLRYADELVGQARNLFRITLVGFLFSLSAVLSTTDAGLALNKVTALSVVQISLPIATLYWLAPAGLFAVYIYLYLYIDRMWLRIAAFPALFPDGLSAEFHLRPWINVGKLRDYAPQKRRAERRWYDVFTLSSVVYFLTIQALVPVALVLFWGRYLPLRDWAISFLHVALFAIMVFIGVIVAKRAKGAFRGDDLNETTPSIVKRSALQAAAVLLVGGILTVLALFDFGRVPALSKFIDGGPFIQADYRGADLSAAAGLSQLQLDGAKCDAKTNPPEGLTKDHCLKNAE